MLDKVDVLIIGSGASGAAVAWSLAETKMHILCLEQGDWVKPTDYPSNGRDWEARLFSDFAINPNRRARPTDYPINDDNSPIKVVNFNGVGGSTIMYRAHFPRLHPSDFKVRTLDGVADDWPIDYATLEPYFAENDRMMGVSGLAGDPAYPAHQPPMPPLPPMPPPAARRIRKTSSSTKRMVGPKPSRIEASAERPLSSGLALTVTLCCSSSASSPVSAKAGCSVWKLTLVLAFLPIGYVIGSRVTPWIAVR